MKNLNKLMLVAMFGLTLTVFADNAIYSKAQSILDSDAPEIAVIYDSSLVAKYALRVLLDASRHLAMEVLYYQKKFHHITMM